MPYQRVNWQNGEAGGTPLNAENLNKMDSQINANTENIAQNTSDIEELKNKPAAALILTYASPLEYTIAAPILGIDVLGKSEQHISKNLSDVAYGRFWENSSPTNNNASSEKRIALLKPIPANKTYTLSFKTTVTDKSFGLYCRYTDDNFNIIETWNTTIPAGATSVILQLNKTNATKACIFLVCDNYATVSADTISSIMLAEGSTALPYEPYTGTPSPTNPIPIVDASGEVNAHTKNILKPNATESVKSGVTITPIYEDDVLQYVELNGTCTSNATYYVVQGLVLDGGNYVLSGCPAGGSSSTYRLGINDGTSTYWDIGESKSIAFNAEKTCDVRISMYSGQTYNHLRFYPMLEVGTSATAYVPYQSNTITLPTLRSIGSVADELIVKADGSGELVQRIKRETKHFITSSKSSSGFWSCGVIEDIKAPDTASIKVNGLCDKYKVVSINDGKEQDFVIAVHNNKGVFINDSSADTYLDVMVEFQYELATPTVTNLTPEQVASILALHTYKGTTIVDSELDVKSVEYAGDVKAYIDAKTNYSYEEKLIGKWVDGKDLYQIVKRANVDSMYIQMVPINGEYVNVKSAMGTVGNCILPYDYNDAYAKILINDDMGYTYFTVQVSSSFDNQIAEIIFTYTKNDTVPAISAFSIDDEAEGE